MDMIFDFGNAQGKWYGPFTNTEGVFMHAIAELSENEWRKVAGRGRAAPGILKVNGKAYAVGKAARRYLIKDRPRGAARYRADYYGVALAFAMTQAFERDIANLNLVASYPPGDIDYVPHLIQSAIGIWNIESQRGLQTFQVSKVSTFDEPLGGYSHYAFNKDGTPTRKNAYSNSTVLVVDVGGYTVDVVAIDPGGEIDLMSAESTRTGVINMTESFESEIRANNRDLFQSTGDIDPRRLEAAIQTGIYHFGNRPIDCVTEAHAAVWSLVNDVIQVINAAGGVANFDVILMTGGGAVLIANQLIEAIPHIDFVMADPNRDKMMYANVYGGSKITALLRRMYS